MSPVLRRTTRPARTLATSALAVGLALGLAGCGAGLRAQTYQERATADATNEAVGEIDVRNLRVEPRPGDGTYPTGTDAKVTGQLVNNGDDDDRLTSVTSTGATSVEVLDAGGRPTTLTVPGQGVVKGFTFLLRGLTAPLTPGEYVTMQLSFQVNGSATMLVPVAVTGTPAPRRSGYEAGETDSAGNPIVEPGEGSTSEEGGEGQSGVGGIDSEGGSGQGQAEEANPAPSATAPAAGDAGVAGATPTPAG